MNSTIEDKITSSRDLRAGTKYTKHGRDTPQGRAKYEQEHKKCKAISTQTAENADGKLCNVIIDLDQKRNREAICLATTLSSDGVRKWDTVMKCQRCNKWTSRADFCDKCREKEN